MALATESDSRNRSLPQHGRGRDSAQVSITVRPGTMRKTVLGISREKPCENRRERADPGGTAMPGQPVPKAAEIRGSESRVFAGWPGIGVPISAGSAGSGPLPASARETARDSQQVSDPLAGPLAIRPTRDPALPQHGKPREIPSKCRSLSDPAVPGWLKWPLPQNRTAETAPCLRARFRASVDHLGFRLRA